MTYKVIQSIKGFGSFGIEENSDLGLKEFTKQCKAHAKTMGCKIIKIEVV